MNPMKDKSLALGIVYVLGFALTWAYVKHNAGTVWFTGANGEKFLFKQVGMMEMPQNDGTPLYVPAYRRYQE
jgi:hypothetical protein